MTPRLANKLLHGPTSDWIEHMDKNPNWGQAFAQHVLTKAVSPLFAMTNLRKLHDCLANPEVQPVLCNWIDTFSSARELDKEERIQQGLARAIRSIQLQAFSRQSSISILEKLDTLTALAGVPFNSLDLQRAWILQPADIVQRNDYFFSNGQKLGKQEATIRTLSLYQKNLVEAMAKKHRGDFDSAASLLHLASTFEVADVTRPLAVSGLWEHSRMTKATKYGLAHSWYYDDSPWATREHDRLLSPKKTNHWIKWAEQAQLYLTLTAERPENMHELIKALKKCPAVMGTSLSEMEEINQNLFEIPHSML